MYFYTNIRAFIFFEWRANTENPKEDAPVHVGFMDNDNTTMKQ